MSAPPNPLFTPRRSLGLTRSQRQVVEMIARGMLTHEVAADLRISVRSAHNSLEGARNRLGARSNAQLVAIAVERGEIAPPPAAAQMPQMERKADA